MIRLLTAARLSPASLVRVFQRSNKTVSISPSASYAAAFNESLKNPQQFWANAAKQINWSKQWETVLDNTNAPFNKWFAGGALNTCYNAVDRHVENGRGNQLALIYDSAMTKTQRMWTFAQLQEEVGYFSGALANLGVSKGDSVVIYMPMVPEAVVAMLACARIGAIHSVVFGGFAAHELAVRIDDIKPRLIVSASCGLEPGRVLPYKPLLDHALEISEHKPQRCVILQRPELQASLKTGRDVEWSTAVKHANAKYECVPVNATDPLYVLYTSGM